MAFLTDYGIEETVNDESVVALRFGEVLHDNPWFNNSFPQESYVAKDGLRP
jgi:hypothetical protein